MTKQKPICTGCGSDDISVLATATWDMQTQNFQLYDTMDCYTCNNCGEEVAVEMIDTENCMVGYKLFRLRKNMTLGPLFINRRQVIELGILLQAEDHPTKGYAHRPGWHLTDKPYAPHLTMKGRVWAMVIARDYVELERPESQGGKWYLAQSMEVVTTLTPNEVRGLNEET